MPMPAVAPAGVQSPDTMPIMKARLLEAEFGHTFTVDSYKTADIVSQLQPLLRAVKNRKAGDALLNRYAVGTPIPKALAVKAKLIVDTVMEQ